MLLQNLNKYILLCKIYKRLFTYSGIFSFFQYKIHKRQQHPFRNCVGTRIHGVFIVLTYGVSDFVTKFHQMQKKYCFENNTYNFIFNHWMVTPENYRSSYEFGTIIKDESAFFTSPLYLSQFDQLMVNISRKYIKIHQRRNL